MLNFKLFRIIFVFNILNACLCLYSDNVRQYDPETFKTNIGGRVPQFISFYAPWCPHSRRSQPVWNELAEKYNVDSSNQTLMIAKVDCTAEDPLCVQEHISSYPSLLFYNAGKKQGVEFEDPLSLENLEKFIAENMEKTAVKKRSLPVMTPERGYAVELTDDNFRSFLRHGLHFVKFYTPWCEYSQEMAPAWEELARDLQNDESVTISSVDCEAQEKACEEYKIEGYPEMWWIIDGKKVTEFDDYEPGDRTFENFKKFIRDMKRELRESEVEVLPGRIFRSKRLAVAGYPSRLSCHKNNYTFSL